MSALEQIDHIVVLMLENRSFDCMLGKLYPASPGFDGLTGSESNIDTNGQAVRVWNSPGTDSSSLSIPDPDPGELFVDINMQLFGNPNPASPAPAPTMSGFARNYVDQKAGDSEYDPKKVMHYFTPEQVPVISRLARQFAVCDRWFASAPCQTWPNRFFVHTATANGYVNNSPTHFPYTMDTIYNRFELAGRDDWKIYFHDIAQSKTLAKLWLLPDHFHFYEQFRHDAAQGTLPGYSFIEPRYFSDWSMPNDQHPPHVVTLGEQLIADVYNNLRCSSVWTKTLLVITYDEHGGCYDHVPPPSAAPPSNGPSAGFNFDRYGVRVPAVIVCPYIPQATVLRPPGPIPYDHTSILATLRRRFPELGPPLSGRDAVAPDLANVLTLENPTNLGPEWLDALPYAPAPNLVARVQDGPLNKMQQALVDLAANLPNDAVAAKPAWITDHIQQIAMEKKSAPGDALANVRSGAAFVKMKLGNFFNAAATPTPSIVDMNHNDAVTNFADAARSGIVGIIHKASTGATGQDSAYITRKNAALAAGLLWGAYHWGTAADVDSQIANFLNVINPKPNPSSALDGVLIALDFETTTLNDGSDDTMSLAQAREFITKLDKILGRKVVIYSGNLLKEGLGNTVDAFWAAHRLWLAQYGSKPVCQACWQQPWLWQYSADNSIHIPGIPGDTKGAVDCNTFLRTTAELRAEWAS